MPIPDEHAAEGQEVEAAVQTSLREAAEQGVSGSAATPFMLKRIAELTGGRSLAANIRLVKNNAAVGARVAVALAAAP